MQRFLLMHHNGIQLGDGGHVCRQAGIRSRILQAYSKLLKDNKLSIYSEPPAAFQGDVMHCSFSFF